jgi:anti-anti-sigma factor
MTHNTDLQFQVERLQHVAIVNCSGRMVRGAALDQFRRSIEQLDHVRALVLDVSSVDHIDAGGLGTLLLVRRWAAQRSVVMKLVNPSVFFRRLLEATHLSSAFEISSLKDAIGILRSNSAASAAASTSHGCTRRFAIA